MTLALVIGDTCSFLLWKLLGEYHKNETLKGLYIYFGLLGHLQELHETETIENFLGEISVIKGLGKKVYPKPLPS